MEIKHIISYLMGLAGFVGLCFSIYFFLETRHANKDDTTTAFQKTIEQIDKVGNRLEAKILNDRYNDVQQQIWDLEPILEKDPENELAKQELQRKLDKKDKLGKKLDKYEQNFDVELE